jgi:hypothetical protein
LDGVRLVGLEPGDRDAELQRVERPLHVPRHDGEILGRACRDLLVTLADGTVHTLRFTFTK